MKRFILFTALTALFTLTAYSQPELTVNSIPEIGSSFVEYECDTTGVSDGAAGANQNWDFSDLVQSTEESPIMFTIEAPENGERYEEFPGADFAQVFYDGSVFYKLNGSKLERLGVGFSEGIEKLDDLSTIMEFPFGYGDSFEDEFSGSMVASDGEEEYTMDRSGSIEMVADGYGTLIMPFGTFNNVLRVKSIQEVEDSFEMVPGMPPMISRDYNVSYTYYLESSMFPILIITHTVFTYENYPYPMEPEYYNDISYIEFDAVISQKPTVPQMYSPLNFATNVELPVTLWWDESELNGITNKKNDKTQDEIMYTLQVNSSSSFEETVEIEHYTNETYAEITDLELGKTYYWRVKAEYKDQSSDWSEPWEFTVAEEQVEYPDPPALLSPEDGATEVSLTPTFSWSSSDEITEWNFMITQLVESGDSLVYLEISLTEPMHTITMQLNGNTTYNWSVRGNDGENWSEWSEPFEFRTLDATSVSEIINAANVSINPNPIKSALNLTFNSLVNSNANISIIDLTGKTVFASDNHSIIEGSNNIALNLNGLNAGVYFLILNGDNLNISKKIIISE